MRQKKRLGMIITACGLILQLCACDTGSTAAGEPLQESREDLLGTVISVSIYDKASDELLEDCFAVVSDIDRRMSVNRKDSEVSKLNQSAGKSVQMSKDIYGLLQKSVAISEKSGGAFDASIGAVSSLWKEDGYFAVLPEDTAIQQALPLVDYRRIQLEQGAKVTLEQPGMQVDLGGIAKGYACDQVYELLKENKVEHALLDFGGNIYACGTKPDGSSWRVGVREPRANSSELVGAVAVKDQAVVTSGIYERHFEKNGTDYHHLLDPKTGYPAANELLSVTIISDSSTEADCLSTACFVLGLEKGMQLAEQYENAEAIFITDTRTVYLTDGVRDSFRISNQEYQLARQ